MRRIFICFLLFIMASQPVSATEMKYEEPDTPISFKIELVPWELVNKILPNESYFTIIDVETGLQFRVQRRAGSDHADVQPLTHKDTKIMKQIYGGKWSWKRRAIFVQYDDQLIAASMNGMPHGAGALKNGFPGHFCVHFFGSTTHRSNTPDLAHLMMQLKARGKIDDFVASSDPYQLINIVATAIHQKDDAIIRLTMDEKMSKKISKQFKNISSFKVIRMSYLPVEDLHDELVIEVPVDVEMYIENSGKVKKNMIFIIHRASIIDRWYIDGEELVNNIKSLVEIFTYL